MAVSAKELKRVLTLQDLIGVATGQVIGAGATGVSPGMEALTGEAFTARLKR